jgi:hypothetical protein
VNQERIYSNYVDWRGENSLMTTNLGEGVMQNSPFQDWEVGEQVKKDVLVNYQKWKGLMRKSFSLKSTECQNKIGSEQQASPVPLCGKLVITLGIIQIYEKLETL